MPPVKGGCWQIETNMMPNGSTGYAIHRSILESDFNLRRLVSLLFSKIRREGPLQSPARAIWKFFSIRVETAPEFVIAPTGGGH
jgi:hypothetical protein